MRPFLALRSYLPADHESKHLEIGSEANPAAFIDVMLELSAEWRRILAPHGSLVLELGDTYSGSGGAGGDYNADGLRDGQEKFNGTASRGKAGYPMLKSLCMVPELYRVALAYGINPLTGSPSPAGRWRVRNVVRWVRPNPPVGALGDKFRPATSDLVVACTAGDRFFDLDAVRVPWSDNTASIGRVNGGVSSLDGGTRMGARFATKEQTNPAGAPPLDWWQIVPGGYSGAHYAVWPPALCEKPIEAMCPRRVCTTCGKPSRRITTTDYVTKNGKPLPDVDGWRSGRGGDVLGLSGGKTPADSQVTTVGWSSCGCPNTDGLQLDGYHSGTGWRPGLTYDPFCGSGTTLVVAHGHSRDSIGADLDPRNAMLAAERLGMFLTIYDHPTQTQQKEDTHGIA